MNEKLDTVKENVVQILGGIAVVFGLYLMFFYGENLRIVVYAVVFHFAIYLLILRKYIKTSDSISIYFNLFQFLFVMYFFR